MSRTVKGGSSPRQVAAIRGRKLIRERSERQFHFRKLKNMGKLPPVGDIRS